MGLVVVIGKQQGQVAVEIFTVAPQQHVLQFLSPGQWHAQTDEAVFIISLTVVEARLIGEETGNHAAEEVAVTRIVLLIHFIYQQAYGIGLDVVNVLRLVVEGCGNKVDVYTPNAFGNVGR